MSNSTSIVCQLPRADFDERRTAMNNQWGTISASHRVLFFYLTPIVQVPGETAISLINTWFGSKPHFWRYFTFLVRHTVWPLFECLKGQRCWKTHFTHLKSLALLLWIDLRPFGWPQTGFFCKLFFVPYFTVVCFLLLFKWRKDYLWPFQEIFNGRINLISPNSTAWYHRVLSENSQDLISN